jgi:molybdopterin converting factor small subunit
VENIEIKIQFFGHFSKQGAEKEIKVKVKNDVKEISKKIDDLIVEKMGTKTAYVLLVNGINYAVYNRKNTYEKPKSGDVFSVIPVVQGG